MYVDNITSKGVTLNSAGKSMQIEVYEKEIERLNNVINELEKYIKETQHGFPYSEMISKQDILDKLKALKEKK